MRVRHSTPLVSSEDSEGKFALAKLPTDIGETVLDGYTGMVSGATVLDPDDGEYLLPLATGLMGDAAGVLLIAYGDADVTLNGGAPIQLRRGAREIGETGPVRAATARMLLEADLTSVGVTPLLAGTRIVWNAWGDEA